MKFDDQYYNKPVTVVGSKNGEKQITPTSEDPYLIIRIENLEDNKVTAKGTARQADIFTLDFTNATLEYPVGKDAVRVANQEENMDMVEHASALIGSDVTIEWQEKVAKLKGKVHWYDFTGTEHFSSNPSGHFVPIIVSGYEGKEISVTRSDDVVTTLVDPKWVFRVEGFKDKSKKAKISVDGNLVAELDFSELTLEQPLGKYAVSIPENLNFGTECGNANEMCKNAKIEWTGTEGSVTGTFYKENKAKKFQCPIVINNYYKGKQITVHVTTDTTLDSLEWHNVLGDTEETAKAAKVTVKDGQTVLATLSFSKATFDNGSAEN